MTTLYTSNDPATGFDADAAGAIAPGWANAAGTWQVGTAALVGGHAHSFGSATGANGDAALLSGIVARTDMSLAFLQQYPSTAGIRPMVRMDAAYQNGYLVLLAAGSPSFAPQLYKRVSGTFSAIGTYTSACSIAAGQILGTRFECVGNTLRARLWNASTGSEPGTWDFSVTDNSVIAPGQPGLYLAGAGARGATDVLVSDIAALAVANPGTVTAGLGMTVAGTYGGADPAGLSYAFDGGAAAAAVNPSIGGGAFAFAAPAPAAGTHTVTVTESGGAGLSAASASFSSVTGAVSVAADNAAILYSPFTWNLGPGQAATINAGAYFRTLFSGAACTLNFNAANMAAPASALWWRIDNGPWTKAAVAAQMPLAVPAATSGNADVPYHLLEVMVKSTTETANRWNAVGAATGTAVIFTGLTLAGGAAVAAPQRAPLSILVLGDGLVEGKRTLGEAAANDTERNDARLGWAWQLGPLLGAEVGVAGFAGQGLTVGGAGNVPVLGSAWNLLYAGASRGLSPAPGLVVVATGTDDGTADTLAAGTALLNGLIAACPGVPIAVLRPFGGNQAANLQAAIAACAAPAQCHWIDTTGFFATGDGADRGGVVPSGPNNVGRIAPQIARALRGLVAGAAAPAFGSRFERRFL